MSSDYSYDQEGQFFPFFFVTISALVIVPITYSALKPSKELENTAPKIQSDFRPEHADLVDSQRRKQKKKQRKLKRIVLAVLGWLFIAVNIYWMVTTQRTVAKIWDPYEILDVPRGSTERQVQSRYRKLSLTLHPDKARPDPAKNETAESINEAWVEIIKAYKTLTDDDVRANYEQYGNPDGKQSTSIGIALPKFLVEEGNGKYVMLVYGVVLGILLPYLVGSWWYGSQKVTREGILFSSVGRIFREYSERIEQSGVINALSAGDEFGTLLKGHKSDAGLGQIEKRILAPSTSNRSAAGLNTKDKAKLEDLGDGPRRKALALIWAYLGRTELDDQDLNDEKLEVAPTALALNDSFISIALAFMFTGPVLAAYRASQSIIQAVSPEASPLLQLPHMTRESVKQIEDAAPSTQVRNLSVQSFMDIPEAQRRSICKGVGLTTSQYDEAVNVASQLPRLVVERTFFKVTGEKYVIPNSLVQFVVKARFIPPGTSNVPDVHPSDLEDVDEDDEDPKTRQQRENEAESKQHQPPLANAPYFARDHSPRWHLLLGDARQGKIAVPPFTFKTFDEPIVTADGKPTFNVQTLKMQFQAPPQPGQYKFQMHLVCDSYIGFDEKIDVTMTIDDADKADEVESDEDISEPEEDTIAGQMAALRGADTANGKPKTKAKRRLVKEVEDHSSEDESGTDEDEEQSESETDTETESDTDSDDE